jgi:hypothetical protein
MFTGTSSLSKQGHNSETIKATIELDMCFVVEWVRLLLNDKWAIFQIYMPRISYIQWKWWWCLLCSRPTSGVGFL